MQAWTATTNGGYAPKPYYLRVTKNGDPDVGTLMQVSDGGPNIDQRLVVDPSFLELVRLGVKPASDPVIRNSIAVVDSKLSYTTKNGRFWHRASFDGYGEQSNGAQWEPSDPGSGQDRRPRLAALERRARGVRARGGSPKGREAAARDHGARS